MKHNIKCGWMKLRKVSGILYDGRIPIKLNGKFYKKIEQRMNIVKYENAEVAEWSSQTQSIRIMSTYKRYRWYYIIIFDSVDKVQKKKQNKIVQSCFEDRIGCRDSNIIKRNVYV